MNNGMKSQAFSCLQETIYMCIQVLVANKHAFIRNGLRFLLDTQPDIMVVGEADCALDATALVKTMKPDVLVIDLALVPQNGIRTAEAISRSWAGVSVIVYSLRRNAAYVEQCLDAGARGYVLAESLGAEIVSAVRTVNKGELFLSSKLLYMNTAATRLSDCGLSATGLSNLPAE